VGVEVALIRRGRASPYAGRWLRGAILGIDAGHRWTWRPDAVLPWRDEPVDAWLLASADDLARMLAGQAPVERVGFRLGDRDVAPRLKQARALCGLAALGWCGPWPDPAADPELVRLHREALFDLAMGPADRREPLFPSGAPFGLDAVGVRFTDGARPRWVTVGLPDELTTTLGPRVLRLVALFRAEQGGLPSTLEAGDRTFRLSSRPLPLPDRLSRLVEIR
jgi:hypothetical protein